MIGDVQEPSPIEALEHAEQARALYALSGEPRMLEASIVASMVALGRDDVLIWGDRRRDNPTRTAARHLLGANHVERYRRTSDISDLETGLRHLLDALEALPEGDPVRGERLQEIAEALLQAVEHISPGESPPLVASHLTSAEAWLEESVALAQDDGTRAFRLSSLGNALRLRFVHLGDRAAVDRAIGVQQQACALAREGAPRAAAYGNLGATLMFADLEEEAIDAFRSAVAASAEGSRDHSGHLRNLAQALIHTGANAAEVDAALADAAAARSSAGGNRAAELRLLIERARLAEQTGRWADAAAEWAAAGDLQRELVRAQVTRRMRERQLLDVLHIAADLAHARARAGDHAGAAVALEDGRAWLWSEALALDDIEPTAVRDAGHPELAGELADALERVRALDVTQLGTLLQEFGADDARMRRRRLQSVLDRVRSTPGLAELFAPPPEAQVESASGHTAVYVAHAEESGLAVAVSGRETWSILLPSASTAEVHERALDLTRAHEQRHEDRDRWMRALDEACRWLWDAVVEPLLDGLGTATGQPLDLVPSGWLGMFPLHAAWTPDHGRPTGRRYALDLVSVAYGPNLRSLARASRATARPLLTNAVIVADAGAHGELVDTRYELEAIAGSLPTARTLTSEQASETRILEALATASLAHVACHGEALPTKPLESALHLGTGDRITVQELMAQRLEAARLVVLSACETASVGRDLPDESVGLPAALLFAGAAAAIGSLWAVQDRSTSLLMGQLYDRMVHADEHPRDALRSTQRWLRDVTNGELLDAGLITVDERLGSDPLWRGAQRYDHPYHWAAFTYTGA